MQIAFAPITLQFKSLGFSKKKKIFLSKNALSDDFHFE